MIGLFLFAAFICYLGVTRLVIQAGLVFVRPPLIPQAFAAYTLGSASISPACMTSLAFSCTWLCDLIACFMPCAANAVRLGGAAPRARRMVFVAIAATLAVGLPISIAYTLHLSYRYGAYNAGGWIFGAGARVPFESIVQKMRNPFPTDWMRLFFLAEGSVVMIALTVVRYKFPWWPVHPLGFAVAGGIHVTWVAFSIFLGWLAKLALIRIGGAKLHRAAWPFFLGLILGHFAGAGISFLVDMIWFVGRGHYLRY